MNAFFPRCLLAAAVLFATFGCDQSTTGPSSAPSAQTTGQPQSLPTITMMLGNRPFTIETATSESTREIGLMHRSSMPADHGMIFAFPNEQPQSFWMKNTLIPLDIVYIDHAGTIVSIQSMKPLDLTGIDSGKPVKFAIELNVGVATVTGLKVGDVIKVPQSVIDAAK